MYISKKTIILAVEFSMLVLQVDINLLGQWD